MRHRSLVACCLLFLPPPVLSLQPLQCAAHQQLFATYDGLQDSLEHFVDFYGEFARNRPKVVAEHVKAFRLHAVAQDFLEIVEAFRLFACLSLCPRACLDPSADNADLQEQIWLVEKLNNLQLDVELLVEELNIDFKANAQQILREAKQYASTLVHTALHSGGEGADWDEALAVCVTNIGSRLMFPLMKLVSMGGKQNESHTLLHGVTLDVDNPASSSSSYISPVRSASEPGHLAELPATNGELSFGLLSSLASGARSLRLLLGRSGAASGSQSLCSPETSAHLAGAEDGWPRGRRLLPPTFNDEGAKGRPRKAPGRIMEMLEHIEASSLDLSHVFLVLRPYTDTWSLNLSCTGLEVDYDPTLCLQERGWGGYVYSVNVHPPFRAELTMLGRHLADDSLAGDSSFVDFMRHYSSDGASQTYSVEHLFYRIDFIWRQANEPSPDVFFLHPSVHNCFAVEYLFSGAPIMPKVLIIPINPLIPPPFEVMPRFEAWMHVLRPALGTSKLTRRWVQHESGEEVQDDSEDDSEDTLAEEYVNPAFWFGQCSLSAVEAVLEKMAKKKFRYVLHHVDGAFAVYVRRDIHKALATSVDKAAPRPFARWLEEWFCVPSSSFFSKLELVAGPEMGKLADPALSDREKEAILCRFLHMHGIPVQQRNFDCAAVVARDNAHGFESLPGGAGRHSCLRQDLRGWGNDAMVFDTVQVSAAACELHCKKTPACGYWTYDPTAMYGQPLCWTWAGGRPSEIKSEAGWVSGDVDCHNARIEDSAGEVAPPEVSPPSVPMTSTTTRAPGDAWRTETLTREIFRQWAHTQLLEVPGMRFFIESGERGRCTQGFCECFPPYRGPLCEHVEAGRFDSERDYSAVLHYLTSDDPVDIEDFSYSLPRLWTQYNSRFDYPVVIFNDGLSEEHRQAIVNASENRVWFAYVDDYLEIPDMLTKDPARKALLGEVKWSLGYRGMCRFRSGTIFLQPVLQKFEYAMTLDTDGYFPARLEEDPIAAMHAGGYIYTFSHLMPDLPGAVKHFWDYSLMYMRMKDIDPLGTPILRQFVREEDLHWNYQLYMNDIEITQLDWFRSDPYQNYFRYLDSIGGFWLHRWGDHAVRTIAVGMWLPEEKVYEMDIPYGHQNYCKCSEAHSDLECVREGDVGGEPARWWTCAPKKEKDG